jgi:hypothetical protein
MKATKSRENGQALIILVVGMIVFLAFVALAIDGSMVYSDRRRAQNGSDAASLAAVGVTALALENAQITANNWDCGNADMAYAINLGLAAAVDRAGDNNFAIDYDDSDYNSVSAQCSQEYIGGYLDRYIDFTTHISTTTDTSFLQIVSDGPMQNRVIAIARVRPRQPIAFGNAIVALNEAGCQGNSNGGIYHGDTGVTVDGGGVFSNGCLKSNGNSGYVEVLNAGVEYVAELIDPHDMFTPDPTQTNHKVPPSMYNVPTPDCGDPNAFDNSDFDDNLEPGLYCLSGDINLNGGEIWGEGVTLYFIDGSLSINGNVEVYLTAPPRSPDPAPAIPGLLIYLPPTNNSEIRINGNAGNYFQGTILAPASDIIFEGTADADIQRAQVIGYNVQAGGNAKLNVFFDENLTYSKPTFLELFK